MAQDNAGNTKASLKDMLF